MLPGLLEFFLFGVVLFFIAILFYKQANEEFQILQLEAERLDDLHTILSERAPIVVRDFQTPPIGTQEALEKQHSLLQMAIDGSAKTTLRQLLAQPAALAAYRFTPTTAEYLATQSGLKIWFEHHLYPKFLPRPWLAPLMSFRTELWPHHRGLTKSTAIYTIVMPTQGNAIVSLLLPKMTPYLPSNWKGRPFSSLSQSDTPLIGQIQFLEIKLRKGAFAILPPHLIYDVRTAEGSEQPVWTFIGHVHTPISRLGS